MSKTNRRAARYLTRGLAIFGAGAFALHAWRLGLTLGGARRGYRIDSWRLPPSDSQEFCKYIATMSDAQVQPTRIAILRNGEEFYPAELEAIRAARRSINLEAYGFLEGSVTRAFLETMIERARAGVEIRIVIDAIGSWHTHSAYFDGLRAAGGRVARYHPVDSKSWPYLNNRTHRKLLVIDGEIGFIGGAGWADHWSQSTETGPPWRDTVFRIQGGAVPGLNSVFAENWLETTGEILAGDRQFRFPKPDGGVPAMVAASTPHGGATRARMLYQTLIEAAAKSIHITTPYFVPDGSARKALQRASRRGVSVKILSTGPFSDYQMTRRIGRMYDLALDKAGAAIYEYQPAMIHAKLMTIDGIWTVAGSTNFDHRSFDLNDEVNIVVFDRETASAIDRDFERDLAQSHRVALGALRSAPLAERLMADASWVIRREQ